MLWVCGVSIGHAEKLQAIEVDDFFVEDTDACSCDSREKRARIAKFFVVAFAKESSKRKNETTEGSGGVLGVDGGTVEQVASDNGEVGIFGPDEIDDTCGKAAFVYMA